MREEEFTVPHCDMKGAEVLISGLFRSEIIVVTVKLSRYFEILAGIGRGGRGSIKSFRRPTVKYYKSYSYKYLTNPKEYSQNRYFTL